MSSVTPEEVRTQLKKQVSSRVQSSLDALFVICQEQLERGVNDFSFSTIAKLGKNRGVPAAQSMRNKSGEPYRTLIQAFTDTASKNISVRPKPIALGNSLRWIDEIQDPILKLQVNILYSQKKEAERLLQEVVPINQMIEIFDGESSSVSKIMLTPLEREAFDYLLSNEFLRREALEQGQNGSILRQKDGSTMFPTATLDALKKALLYL